MALSRLQGIGQVLPKEDFLPATDSGDSGGGGDSGGDFLPSGDSGSPFGDSGGFSGDGGGDAYPLPMGGGNEYIPPSGPDTGGSVGGLDTGGSDTSGGDTGGIPIPTRGSGNASGTGKIPALSGLLAIDRTPNVIIVPQNVPNVLTSPGPPDYGPDDPENWKRRNR